MLFDCCPFEFCWTGENVDGWALEVSRASRGGLTGMEGLLAEIETFDVERTTVASGRTFFIVDTKADVLGKVDDPCDIAFGRVSRWLDILVWGKTDSVKSHCHLLELTVEMSSVGCRCLLWLIRGRFSLYCKGTDDFSCYYKTQKRNSPDSHMTHWWHGRTS